MKDYDTPEEREKRATQEDPIVMYLIVRESLDMSIGKTAAQTAHASQMLTLKYFDLKELSTSIQRQMNPIINSPPEGEELAKLKAAYAHISRPISIMGEWLQGSFRKVVLRASDKEWDKISNQLTDYMGVMVVDAGLTEIAAGSETVIGLWPMRKSQRPKIIQRLQVLK